MTAIRDQRSNKDNCGGIARYENDYYFKVEPDTKLVPGNPWFMCTMWLAQWYVAIAKNTGDLKPAQDIINWARAHQLPGGLLADHLHPPPPPPPPLPPPTLPPAAPLL